MLKNPRVEDGKGLIADLILNPKHALYESIMFDWENGSPVGLSHMAEGPLENGIVTEIVSVASADLTTNPATVVSLREEEESEFENLKKQIQAAAEELAVVKKEHCQLLAEVQELKAKKPVSYTPQLATTSQETAQDFAKRIRGIK